MARIDNRDPLIGPNHVSLNWYDAALPGQQFSSTNTTPLGNDVIYASPCFACRPVTISDIGFRTSGTNASVGASVKLAVYAADGANGVPGTLLGSTGAISVTDAALNTFYSGILDKEVFLPGGLFWIAIIQTSTTGVRTAMPTISYVVSRYLGNFTSGGNIYSGSTIPWGYTGVGTYVGGFPDPFGTPTLQTSSALSPSFVYKAV